MTEKNRPKKGRKRKEDAARGASAAGGGAADGRKKRLKKTGGAGTAGAKAGTKNAKARAGSGPAGGGGSSAAGGAVDVDHHCGVALASGGQCARSLTCKTHSMGAKRAVLGRSQPYDVLLAEYQKRKQVKLASISTQQQLAKDNEALLGDEEPLNDDDECREVMHGVLASKPQSLERHVIMPTATKTHFVRLREMLVSAMTGLQPGTAGSAAAASAVAAPATAPEQEGSVAQVMAATKGVLGRAIVFDVNSGAQYARPPRGYVAPTPSAEQQALIQRQRQLLHYRQMQQMQQMQQLKKPVPG